MILKADGNSFKGPILFMGSALSSGLFLFIIVRYLIAGFKFERI